MNSALSAPRRTGTPPEAANRTAAAARCPLGLVDDGGVGDYASADLVYYGAGGGSEGGGAGGVGYLFGEVYELFDPADEVAGREV